MQLYNSLSNSKEEFISLTPKKVTIYVCGITPYDTTHLGHAFTYISFDVLIRYLKFQGYGVIYTQNVTDINDRDKDILQRAKEQNISWTDLAKFWTDKFLSDMDALNWTRPTYYLKASEQIPEIISLIQKLLANNFAYSVNGSVYLDTSKFKDYGKLSKLSKPEMLKVAKDFEEDLDNPDKKNPLDLTLWRAHTNDTPSHIPSFDSPFGKGRPADWRGSPGGRPGWHIECSAMATSSLGEQVDIHGGGKDLIYPHHESEIVQSEGATGKIPFAKYWMHTGTVFYQGQKMSKSKGNLVMVSDLLKKYSPNAIRWLLLSHHWHEDWEFKEEDLIKSQNNVDLVENSCLHLGGSPRVEAGGGTKDFLKFMDNNLDTPKTLELLLKYPNKVIFETLGFKIE